MAPDTTTFFVIFSCQSLILGLYYKIVQQWESLEENNLPNLPISKLHYNKFCYILWPALFLGLKIPSHCGGITSIPFPHHLTYQEMWD